MTQTTYLHFEGLNHPVALQDAHPLEPMIAEVLGGWPYVAASASDVPPFVTISPNGAQHWDLTLVDAPAKPRRWDAVNVICDLVAEMAWERLRSDPALLCLHAAAVAFSGRLVIFPNARRAGKSTLAAVLAQMGHRIYTDDFLPVRIDPQDQTFCGIANGIAPRIRLPLPETFGGSLQAWVGQDAGPSNKQYKYLCDAPVARGGETMPLGAMVLLDRVDVPTAPDLAPMSRADALESLLTQNFARTQISGAILSSMDAMSRHLPVFRLTYHCAQEAAEFLSTHAALQDLPAAKNGDVGPRMAPAPLDQLSAPKPEFAPACKYVQAPGLTETQAGDEHFLADANGLGIYRMNAGSVAIWRVLAEPTDLQEVVEILSVAFEDVPVSQIASDADHLMRNLVAAGLIVPAKSEMAAE